MCLFVFEVCVVAFCGCMFFACFRMCLRCAVDACFFLSGMLCVFGVLCWFVRCLLLLFLRLSLRFVIEVCVWFLFGMLLVVVVVCTVCGCACLLFVCV